MVASKSLLLWADGLWATPLGNNMNISVTEHFCVFLDILGYKNRIEMTQVDSLNSELERFVYCVGSENDFLKKLSDHLNFKMKTFTDNIVICIPITKESIEKFDLVLSHIIDYQKSLISSNYFVRGGISKGLLYMENDIIWGPALIKAVNLEKNGMYPFIFISDEIIELFSINNLQKSEQDELSVPIIEFNDKMHILDYLQSTIYYEEEQLKSLYAFLPNHKSLIEMNLKTSDDCNVLGKYAMLAKYHDNFCNYYLNDLPDMQAYLINKFINPIPVFNKKCLSSPHDGN